MDYKYRATCLVCEHDGWVSHKNKEDYKEVTECPKCKGAFVDRYKLIKYKPNNKAEQPEKKYEGILASMGLDLDTAKFEKKLQLIAKHCEALANELEAIDNAWQCECGSFEYSDAEMKAGLDDEVISRRRVCDACNQSIALPLDENE